MKVMGLDVSSHSTGWNVVEKSTDLKLLGYGLIQNDSLMSQTQRLYFQGNELRKIIEKFCPDEIGIEETILVRGPKIMRTLSRFSGVAIFQAYSYQKKDVHMFEPSSWKKILGVGGNAKKAEVQLEVCSQFKLLTQKQIEIYKEKFSKIELNVCFIKKDSKQKKMNRKEINKKVKEIERAYDKISVDIYSDCGINNDIADSIAISLAVLHETK